MTMTRLALSGLRHRTGAFVATFLSAALGAAILMTFASLIDTAAGAGVDSGKRGVAWSPWRRWPAAGAC